ncbi:MAG: DUF1990 family protein [Vicinamibacterales bacterium]
MKMKTEWRFLRGWTDEELTARLASAAARSRNFDEADREMASERGWGRHFSEAVIAREPPGPPERGGPFDRAWTLVADYFFSDPRIVKAHFDRSVPLLERRMLLEVRVWGLHYLGPAMVTAVLDDREASRSARGFRYDTIEGHFERGAEWFVVAKNHATGDVTFRIHAGWKRGELPNWWSRIGFNLLARRYQRAWHRLAHLRLRAMLGSAALPPLPRGARLVHTGPPFPVPAVQAIATGGPPAVIGMEEETGEHRLSEAS